MPSTGKAVVFTSLRTSLVSLYEVTSLTVLRKHIAITDVFFPTGMVLSDASDITSGKKEAPTLVHLVAMSVSKESGDLEGSSDLHLQLLKRFISDLHFFVLCITRVCQRWGALR